MLCKQKLDSFCTDFFLRAGDDCKVCRLQTLRTGVFVFYGGSVHKVTELRQQGALHGFVCVVVLRTCEVRCTNGNFCRESLMISSGVCEAAGHGLAARQQHVSSTLAAR